MANNISDLMREDIKLRCEELNERISEMVYGSKITSIAKKYSIPAPTLVHILGEFDKKFNGSRRRETPAIARKVRRVRRGRLGSTDLEVLSHISNFQQGDGASARHLATFLGKPNSTIQKSLQRLVKKKKLARASVTSRGKKGREFIYMLEGEAADKPVRGAIKRKLLDLLTEKKMDWMTPQEIAGKTGINIGTVRDYLCKMVRDKKCNKVKYPTVETTKGGSLRTRMRPRYRISPECLKVN